MPSAISTTVSDETSWEQRGEGNWAGEEERPLATAAGDPISIPGNILGTKGEGNWRGATTSAASS